MGVDAVTLEESYARCRELNRRYGTTYYRSTFLLPTVKRHHVHALYGFCRYADDIVDDLGSAATPAERQQALTQFGDRFMVDLARGASGDPVLKAVVHTVRSFDIGVGCFERFLRSMAMDFTHETYETFEDLLGYMDGSAAVIGEMMLPILEPTSAEAFDRARDLGVAFQLSNFLRDVAEDLDRGRVYLPQEDLRRFGTDPWARQATPAWRRMMAFQVARTRRYYASADLGVAFLPPRSATCIRGARALYSGILDQIEEAGYDVFARRVRVPAWRKLAVAGRLVRP
ncbi:MAG: phytoene/squalene synthase family protein [Acidimicrobiales bacterium]